MLSRGDESVCRGSELEIWVEFLVIVRVLINVLIFALSDVGVSSADSISKAAGGLLYILDYAPTHHCFDHHVARMSELEWEGKQ